MFFNAKSLRLRTNDSRWNIEKAEALEIITADAVDTYDSELTLEDLSNASFNTRVLLEQGVLKIELIDLNAPIKIKYWDLSTFSGVVKNPDRAFEWWEY